MNVRRSMGAAVMAGIAATAVAVPVSASASTTPTSRPGTVVSHSRSATVQPDGSWLGTCYSSYGATWGGGWCDGNGPNWQYQGYVYCKDGGTYYSVVRWAGDRRGSYASCPIGVGAYYGGVTPFYQP